MVLLQQNLVIILNSKSTTPTNQDHFQHHAWPGGYPDTAGQGPPWLEIELQVG